jgi:hypothetical protein
LRQKTLFTGPARWQMGTQLVEQAVAQGAGKPRQDLADWSLTDTQAGAAVGRRPFQSDPSLTVPRHISAPPPATARVSGRRGAKNLDTRVVDFSPLIPLPCCACT